MLQPKKEKKMNFDVGIIGLGYVGLTLATALAKCGMKVVGVERRKDIVSLVNEGKAHFTELGLEQIINEQVKNGNLIAKNQFESSDRCKHFIITVGTPLGPNGKPRLDMIQSAVSEIVDQMDDGATVIVRSTVEVGTTRNCVEAELKKTNKKYFLAMCPERTLEGDAIRELNQSVPIGHIAEPEEIADVVAFLSSDEARYICGSLVEINGGKAVY